DAVVVARGDDAVDAAGLTGARADERLRAESLRSQGGRHRPALAAGEAVVPALSDTSPSRRSLRSQTRGASGTSPDAGPEPAVAPREPALLSRATSIDTRSRQCAAARGAGTAALVDASRERLAIHRVTAIAPKVDLRRDAGPALRLEASALAAALPLTLRTTAGSTRASGRLEQDERRECD